MKRFVCFCFLSSFGCFDEPFLSFGGVHSPGYRPAGLGKRKKHIQWGRDWDLNLQTYRDVVLVVMWEDLSLGRLLRAGRACCLAGRQDGCRCCVHHGGQGKGCLLKMGREALCEPGTIGQKELRSTETQSQRSFRARKPFTDLYWLAFHTPWLPFLLSRQWWHALVLLIVVRWCIYFGYLWQMNCTPIYTFGVCFSLHTLGVSSFSGALAVFWILFC